MNSLAGSPAQSSSHAVVSLKRKEVSKYVKSGVLNVSKPIGKDENFLVKVSPQGLKSYSFNT